MCLQYACIIRLQSRLPLDVSVFGLSYTKLTKRMHVYCYFTIIIIIINVIYIYGTISLMCD